MLNHDFTALIRPHLPLLAPDVDLLPNASLRELGLDSMASVALLVKLESHYRLRMPPEMLSADTFRSPASLWAALREVMP